MEWAIRAGELAGGGRRTAKLGSPDCPTLRLGNHMILCNSDINPEANMKSVSASKKSATTSRPIRAMTCRLKEGESFYRAFPLKGGAAHALTTEGWEDIDALTIELRDHMGRTMAPEIDNLQAALYFVPPDSGVCTLRITVESLAWGRSSAKLRTIVRELPALPPMGVSGL
jgi:hypothetical protein